MYVVKSLASDKDLIANEFFNDMCPVLNIRLI